MNITQFQVIANSLHSRSEESESDENYIMSNGEMIIGFESNNPPMTYHDENKGKLIGFDVEFAEIIGSKLGIDITFKEIQWSSKETELKKKNIDCIWNALTITEQRRNIFEFTRPYMYNRQAVVIRESDASKYTDTKSLSGATIASANSTTAEEVILNDPYLSQANHIASSSSFEALNILKNELCDAIVVDYTFAQYYIPNDNSDLIIIEDIRLQEEQYAVGFRLGSDMAHKLDNLFLNTILDGSLIDLSEKYNLYELFSPMILTDYNYIMNKGKITIGYLENIPPMNYLDENDQLVGFDIEFAKALFEEIGIDIEFKSIDWNDKETDLNNRRIDCIWSALSITEERRKILRFSRVYMSNTQVIMIRKSDASKFTNLESFSEATFSATSDSVGEIIIKNNPYLSTTHYIKSDSPEELVITLNEGEVDAIVFDYTSSIGFIANGYPDLMIVEGISLEEEEYAVGFRYGSDMATKVNEIMNHMISDGRVELLAKKYLLIDLYDIVISDNKKSDLNYIMHKGEIIIGIEDNSPPMSYYDDIGRLTGFNIELITEICSRLGVYVIFKNIDMSKKETELNDKDIDCVLDSQSITEESRNNIDFTIAYLIDKQVVVIRRSDESKFINRESLSGIKMSAGYSTAGENLFKSDPYLIKAKYTASSSQKEAMVALENKSVDAIVIDYAVAKVNIENDYPDFMIVEGISFQEEQYGIGFRAGSNMINKVNNIILDMNMDGTLTSLSKKYSIYDLFRPIKTTDVDYIMGKGKMIIGYDGEFPPLSYYDINGRLIGFDVDFPKELCKRLGIEVEFKVINWDEKEIELKNRNIDCIWNGLNVEEEQRSVIKYSRIYMKYRPAVVIRKSDFIKYTGIENLSSAIISAMINTVEEKAIRNNKYLSKAEYISSSTQLDAVYGLQNKDFDAIIIDSVSAVGYIYNGYSDLTILSELTDGEEESYAIGFRVNSDMTLKVNKLINDMINDGTLESIAKKYNLIDNYKLAISKNEESDFDYIMAKGEMIIGVDVDLPPISYYDDYGELAGFDIDFSKAVCAKLGIDAVLQLINWDKKEDELSSKRIDCVWNALTITEERRNYFKFSVPYLSNRQSVVIRSSDASKYNDTQSLSEATLSAVLGTISEDVIKEEKNLSKATYISSITQDDSILGLRNKTFDALITDYSLAKIIIEEYNDLMIITNIHLNEEEYGVGFRVNSDITEKVNDLILDMILDESLTSLAKKYDLVDLYETVKVTDANYIMNKGSMIIGYDGTMAPMTYYDNSGRLTGFDIDLAKAVCKELGISAEFKEVEWNKKESELKNRGIDCFWSCLSVTEKRREILKFSRVYMNNKQVILIRKSNIVKYNNIESLSEATLSFKTGTLGESAIKTYFPDAENKGFDSIDDLLISLEKGKVDAAILDYTIAKEKINNCGFSDIKIIEGIELMNDEYAIGFRHGSDMSKKVNVILKEMLLNGTIYEIAEKYDLLDLYTHKKTTSIIMIEVFSFITSFLVLILIL